PAHRLPLAHLRAAARPHRPARRCNSGRAGRVARRGQWRPRRRMHRRGCATRRRGKRARSASARGHAMAVQRAGARPSAAKPLAAGHRRPCHRRESVARGHAQRAGSRSGDSGRLDRGRSRRRRTTGPRRRRHCSRLPPGFRRPRLRVLIMSAYQDLTAREDAAPHDVIASRDLTALQDRPAPRGAPSESAIEADRLARLALNHAVEPADPQIGRLLELHSPIAVLAAIRADQLPDLDPDPARHDRLADRCTGLRLRLEPGRVEAGIAAAEAVCARFITPVDASWPARLDDLGQQRPIGIWAIGSWGDPPDAPANPTTDQSSESNPAPTGSDRGSPASTAEMLSIVGARACTGYGSYVAGALGAELASAGMAVVSGAALGIDAAAHRGALAVGGPTVAVLACGIDRVYPRAHEVLLRAIAERGAVFSELPPGASPTRFRFLHRNRIIAALGVGTVVVEAAHRSGSLVTARLAAELGRVVMA